MPTYTYKCTTAWCEYQFDIMQKITEESIKICPQCQNETKKVITSGNFILKGEKWYKNSGSY